MPLNYYVPLLLLLLLHECDLLPHDTATEPYSTIGIATAEIKQEEFLKEKDVTEVSIEDVSKEKNDDQMETTSAPTTDSNERETEEIFTENLSFFTFSLPSTTHSPYLGFIPRDCPNDPLPEVFPVKKCVSDKECWPRICCKSEEVSHRYCRTPLPLWDKLPAPRAIASPLQSAVAYIQCTPPPPKKYDLFPKMCRTTFDCFPNLCCQEGERKICRPPKKSLLALISSAAPQRRARGWFG